MAETPHTSGMQVLLERIAETRAQNPKGAVDLARALVERARRNKDRFHEAAGLYQLGVSEMTCSELTAANDHLNEALRRFRSQGNEGYQVRCEFALANLDLKRGETRRALKTYQELLGPRQHPPAVLADEYSKLLNNLGVCHERLGEYAEALRYYYQSLQEKRAAGDQRGQAYSLHNIATVFAAVGEYRRSAANNRRSLTIFEELGDLAGRGELLIGLAEAHAKMDEDDAAAEFFAQSQQAAKQAGDKALLAKACLGIARMARRAGEMKGAVGHLNVAMGHARRSEDSETITRIQLEMGRVAQDAGDHAQAKERYDKGLALAQSHEFAAIEEQIHLALAGLNETQGHFKLAYQHLQAYQRLHAQLFDRALERRIKAVSVPLEVEKAQAEAKAARLKTVDLVKANEALAKAQSENEALLDQLAEKAERLKRESREDPLTGLANRRRLEEALVGEWERSERFDRSLAVAVFDIDHFKQVNDRFGHATGDEVLVRVGEELAPLLRGSDLLARYGGEEFVLLLPETTLSEATALCERIREHFEKVDWAVFGEGLSITLSFGVASKRGCSDWEGLLKVADEHLYRAKAAGRNRISTGF